MARIGSNQNISLTNQEVKSQSADPQQTHLQSLTVSHAGIMLIR